MFNYLVRSPCVRAFVDVEQYRVHMFDFIITLRREYVRGWQTEQALSVVLHGLSQQTVHQL